MMNKYGFTIVLVFGMMDLVFAQQQRGYQDNNYFELAVGAAPGQFSGALSWYHLHGIGNGRQRFKIGYGLRFTSFVAANQYFTTAPAKYTSPVQSIGTIFSKTITENIDTITTATASTHSINIALYLQYDITPRLALGFNIDAIGFSFGPKRNFNIISSSFDSNQAPVQRGTPTQFNALLTSDNDIGSLNSEFFRRYWIHSQFGVSAGYTFLFSEYRTDHTLSFDNGRIINDRYRYKAGMVLVAITVKPFHTN
jgi:hypothetical protein